MIAGRFSIKGYVGFLISIFGLSTFLYTFRMQLLFEELLLPRFSLLLFIIGGIIIFSKDLRREKGEDVDIDRDFTIFSVLVVGLVMYVYTVMVLNVGLVFATFSVLVALWFLIEYLDHSRRDREVKLSRRLVLSLGLSVGITVLLYALFVMFLDIYMPPTILF